MDIYLHIHGYFIKHPRICKLFRHLKFTYQTEIRENYNLKKDIYIHTFSPPINTNPLSKHSVIEKFQSTYL